MIKRDKAREAKLRELVGFALPKGATLVGSYDSGYGRIGLAYIRQGACDLCGASTKVLGLDSSEGRYSAGQVCLQCTAQALGGEAPKVAVLEPKLEVLDKPSPSLALKGVEYNVHSKSEIVRSPTSHRVRKDKE